MTDASKTKIFVRRDNDRDLEFTGELIGSGDHGTGGSSGYRKDWTRGTDVAIYRTEGGKYIVSVKQWSRWQAEGDVYRAGVCESPAEVLAWLRRDCGGDLGPASKEAWEECCNDPGIGQILNEEVK